MKVGSAPWTAPHVKQWCFCSFFAATSIIIIISEWSLHVLHAWVLSRLSSILPHFIDVHFVCVCGFAINCPLDQWLNPRLHPETAESYPSCLRTQRADEVVIENGPFVQID